METAVDLASFSSPCLILFRLFSHWLHKKQVTACYKAQVMWRSSDHQIYSLVVGGELSGRNNHRPLEHLLESAQVMWQSSDHQICSLLVGG